MGDARADRAAAIAGLVFPVVSTVIYMLARIYERLRVGKIDPSLIVLSHQTDFFWRCGIAAWWGASIAAVVYLALRARSARLSVGRIGLFLAAFLPVVVWAAWRFP